MEKLHTLSGIEIRDKVLRKEISALEVTKAAIDRIKDTDDKLEAYITYNFDAAIEKAKQVDEKLARGEEVGKLAGIPVAVKDNMCTYNLRTTAGSKILGNFIPPYNATVVERMLANDAVIIGKTTMDEFRMGSSGENSAYQKARNPWDTTRVPGGSSAGSAATVAGCQVPMALGSDTGGSIRQPASLCGIVGLKPTYGSVSRYGLIAYASSLDQIGPMTRTVDDAALLFETICGRDSMDATSKNYEFAGYGRDIRGLKLGIPKEYFGDGINAEVKEVIYKAIDRMKGLGAEIVEISLPSTEYALSAYYIIACAEASSNLGRFDGVKYGFRGSDSSSLENLYLSSRSEGFGYEVQRRIMLGSYVLSSGFYDAYYKRAKVLQKQISKEFSDALEICDVIITPLSPTTAFKFGEKMDDPLEMYAADICTITLNIAGLPGINVPCGFDSNGLPIGFQAIGRKFDESTLLTIAKCYENAVGGFEIKEF